MKRLLLAVAAGLTVVALAGAVGLPDLAGAQDAAPTERRPEDRLIAAQQRPAGALLDRLDGIEGRQVGRTHAV